jgi:thiol-disulfide isomerase/thioredoxin
MARSVKKSTQSKQSGGSFGTLLVIVAIGVLAIIATRRRSGPSVDTPAKEFALRTVNQAGQFRLSEHKGNPVVIEVFAGWCSACKSAAPMMARVAQADRKREVCFLGVSVDGSAEEAKSVAYSWGIPYDVALDDGTFSKDYEVSVLPTFVLVDPEGKVRHVASGVPRESDLEAWLGEMGAGRL